jgi:hypothetical protein
MNGPYSYFLARESFDCRLTTYRILSVTFYNEQKQIVSYFPGWSNPFSVDPESKMETVLKNVCASHPPNIVGFPSIEAARLYTNQQHRQNADTLGSRDAAITQLPTPPHLISELPPQDVSDFARYRVPVYTGPTREPDFNGRDRSTRGFRTMILMGVRHGPAFAGHMAVSVFGCGVPCLFGYVTDVRTGRVISMPVGGEYEAPLSLEYVTDSALLRAHWQTVPSDFSSACVYENFVWTGQRFASLGRHSDGQPCPRHTAWE